MMVQRHIDIDLPRMRFGVDGVNYNDKALKEFQLQILRQPFNHWQTWIQR